MGIPYLTSYVQNCKQLNRPIPIDSVKYAIIDGWAIFYKLFHGAKLPTTYGGEYQTMKKLLVEFVKFIRNLGIEPIFVIDSFRDPQKLKTIISRYQSSYQESLNALKKTLADDSNLTRHPLKCNTLTQSKEMRDVLHELNCEIWTPVTDGDPLVVHIAVTYAESIPNDHPNPNVIIVSEDSDFYIFPYPEKVFYCNASEFNRKIQKQNTGRKTRPVFNKLSSP